MRCSLKVVPNLYYFQTFNPQPSAPKSATKTTTFERRAKRALNKYPPLSRAKREKFPSLHTPYQCTQKCHRKPPLLRCEQSKPWKIVPLSIYPLPVHPKVPQKTTTFERWAKRALNKYPPLSRAKQEKFPFYIPLTGAPKSATENHHFWEASNTSPEKCPSLSWAKWDNFPFLHTPYRCTQKCHRKPPLLRGKQYKPWKVPPSLLSEAREVSLSTYPLPVHTKVPKKKHHFWKASKASPKRSPLSLEQSERSFTFYIPLTGAHKSARRNTTF